MIAGSCIMIFNRRFEERRGEVRYNKEIQQRNKDCSKSLKDIFPEIFWRMRYCIDARFDWIKLNFWELKFYESWTIFFGWK